TTPTTTITHTLSLHDALPIFEKVLSTLQTFDPPGVFARDLAECLTLQLKELNRYDPQIAKLLHNLGLLGSHNLAALKRAVGVDADRKSTRLNSSHQIISYAVF